MAVNVLYFWSCSHTPCIVFLPSLWIYLFFTLLVSGSKNKTHWSCVPGRRNASLIRSVFWKQKWRQIQVNSLSLECCLWECKHSAGRRSFTHKHLVRSRQVRHDRYLISEMQSLVAGYLCAPVCWPCASISVQDHAIYQVTNRRLGHMIQKRSPEVRCLRNQKACGGLSGHNPPSCSGVTALINASLHNIMISQWSWPLTFVRGPN